MFYSNRPKKQESNSRRHLPLAFFKLLFKARCAAGPIWKTVIAFFLLDVAAAAAAAAAVPVAVTLVGDDILCVTERECEIKQTSTASS